MTSFDTWFSQIACSPTTPHEWQRALARDPSPRSRLIRIPTGMGKTLGVLAAWPWHRIDRKNDAWPRRLVWSLPMRVLVEQAEAVIREALDRLDLAWDRSTDHQGRVGVHLLMGGAGRARWPLEFGLLSHDALWVMDEVQLMDVRLATSAQLQAYHDQKEVAALLKLAEKTVYAMANSGELPAFKIRGQWRIKRADLDRWLDEQPRIGDRGRDGR